MVRHLLVLWLLEYGRQKEGYWNADRMSDAFNKAMDIFEKHYPYAIGVFFFDWSSCHTKVAENTPNANAMNVNPDGKQSCTRDTTYKGKIQSLVFKAGDIYNRKKLLPGDELIGKAKGLKQVLKERGLWVDGMTQKHDNPKLNMVNVLQQCHDFANPPTFLHDLAAGRGHMVKFLPKFHCELNPIEQVWSVVKQTLKAQCSYNFKDMKKALPFILDTLDHEKCRRFFGRARRYFVAYGAGLDTGVCFKLMECTSHRRANDKNLEVLIQQLAVNGKDIPRSELLSCCYCSECKKERATA